MKKMRERAKERERMREEIIILNDLEAKRQGSHQKLTCQRSCFLKTQEIIFIHEKKRNTLTGGIGTQRHTDSNVLVKPNNWTCV